ncbi:NADPH-dependent F420 reductase [Kitasatospora sp. NPDC058406]|uniref:NADPH-dependent F420 reductase n=1 Tax=Kitasatospora sp. NPDC058406 TaxID=3346483 RepID=UPI00364A98FD
MRIGIIGAGNMARALGGQWARAGHEVVFGARSAARAAEAAQSAGARAWVVAGPAAAAEFGEVVLLAVPADAVEAVVAAAAPPAGRVLVDCTNPIAPGPLGLHLTTAGGPSMAERIAAAAPGTHVVKAFNACHESVWRLTPPVFDGRPLAVPLCGDDPGALALVGRLTADLGATPVTAGPLARAGLLEAATAFAIGLWFAGHDAQAVLPPRQYSGVPAA